MIALRHRYLLITLASIAAGVMIGMYWPVILWLPCLVFWSVFIWWLSR